MTDRRSDMYIEDPEQIYGCWRCGKVMGALKEDDAGFRLICGECGENSVLSFINALDVINDLFVRGILEQEQIDLEDFIDD